MFKIKNKNLFSTVILVTVFLTPYISWSSIESSLGSVVADKVKSNTFIIVPINPFIKPMSEDRRSAYLNENCVSENPEPKFLLNCKQLENCSDESCIAPFETHGTAFLLEKGNQLVTAWHVLFQTHAAPLTFLQNALINKTLEERRQTVLERIEPAFVLLNHNLDMVYDTRADPEDNKTNYSFIGDPLASILHFNGYIKNQAYGYHENILTDVVSIQLNKNLGPGLEQAARNGTSSQTFYNAGFGSDGHHYEFSMNPGQEESLYRLKLASGRGYDPFQIDPSPYDLEAHERLSVHDQLLAMGYSESIIEQTFEDYSLDLILRSIEVVLRTEQRHQRDYIIENDERVLFTNSIGLPGHSGGPVVNKDGQVIGMVATGFYSSYDEDQPRQSFGSGVLVLESSIPLF